MTMRVIYELLLILGGLAVFYVLIFKPLVTLMTRKSFNADVVDTSADDTLAAAKQELQKERTLAKADELSKAVEEIRQRRTSTSRENVQ